ncbi:hypothetical protein E4U16_007046 [Claviceps sp. LM84 group G4]|nr:hypothetical protein E4U16_007046 [Claviceps sp. LM84 group G4]
MARAAVPPEQVFVWRVPPPAGTASTTTTTTTTAPSRPFFAESRATAAASPWARRKREHQSSETTLCFFARVIANYCDRPPQQRQLPAFTEPQSRQQAPLHNLQSHHQPHAPWSIDNRPHEHIMGGKVQRQIGRAISLMRNL